MKLILQKPVITEKAIGATASGFYTFEVDKRANKHQIKEAVSSLFNVDVLEVRTQTRPSVQKRVGRMRRLVKSAATKRALVKIAPSQSIDLFTTPTEDSADTKEKKEAKPAK